MLIPTIFFPGLNREIDKGSADPYACVVDKDIGAPESTIGLLRELLHLSE